jgi:folate-dependent phosphoribosylglycinamide formyltransferase PurN
MARRRSSFGLFGIFGRSQDLRQFDQSLRTLDVHPALVPEAVKLTAVNLIKDHAVDDEPAPAAYRAAAEIIGYCIIGAEGFAGANTDDLAAQVERRIEAALDYTGTLDAQLVLLALHSKIIQPSVVNMFGLESAGN